MTLWQIVIGGSILVLALKVLGYALPQAWLERPLVARVTDLLTIALLGALIATQTVGGGTGLVLDARIPALGAAAILLILRAPFLVVVIGAAATAALLRLLTGMP